MYQRPSRTIDPDQKPPSSHAEAILPHPGLPGRDPKSLVRSLAGGGIQDPWVIAAQALNHADGLARRLAKLENKLGELERLSTTDELTGLANRRGFEQELQRSLSLAQRHRETGIICFVDLDGFKAINDNQGHEAGDIVLCRVAEILRAYVRSSDIVARFAGDEFVVIFQHAETGEARRRAEQLYRLLNNSHANYRGRSIPIKLSMGITEYDHRDDTGQLLRRADSAMYRDKRRRRDQRVDKLSPDLAVVE